MIDDSRRAELALFQPIESDFDDIVMKITIYPLPDRMKPMKSYIKRFTLKLTN